jgi:hypothetical protein
MILYSSTSPASARTQSGKRSADILVVDELKEQLWRRADDFDLEHSLGLW